MQFPYKIIDLTHTLSPNSPSWDASCGFKHDTLLNYQDCDTKVKFHVQAINMHAGIGTHIDAPAHCVPNGKTIDALSIENLVAPCIMIDISSKATSNFQANSKDILEFEKQHGKITQNSFVIFHTGWSQYWHNPEKYRNNHQFPSINIDCAKLLLERNIAGLGIDTLSPDKPTDDFLVHEAILGAEKYIIENVANCQQLPATGSYTIALPIKTAGGTEAPVRLIALIDKHDKSILV